MSDEILEQQEAPTSDRDLFDEVEENQDSPPSEKPSKKPAKEPEEPQEESEEEEEDSEEPEEKKEKEKEPEKEKPEKLSKKYEELLKKHEKIEKNLLETQKYATKKAQQSKQQTRHFEKTIQELVERGSLAEEEAQRALIKPDEDDIPFEVNEDLPELAKYCKIGNTELDNLKKYSDDESLDQKAEAFRFLTEHGSEEELEEITDKLRPLKDDPVALTKAMLKIGQESNQGFYNEIKSLGGIKEYAKYKDEIISSKDNKIEKLEKKLLQYEDYDKRPNYRLSDHSSHNKEEKSSYDDAFDDVKSKDSRPVKRR